MDSKRPQLLFVLTSHDKIGDTGKKTGWYLVSIDSSPFKSHRLIGIQSEFAHPYHSPAAIAKVKLDDGTFLIANSAVTGITNAEEVVFGFENDMPFSLEDALDANSGGGFRKAEEPLGPCVVVAQEGRLMTGQNPASARPLAEALLERLMGK